MFRVRVGHLPDGLDLSGDIMRRAHVVGVRTVGVGLRRTDLRRARIEDCTFADGDLAEVRLAGARIERTTFRHCNLVGADLRDVRFVDVEVVECLTDGLLLDGATWSGRLHLPGHEVAPAR